MPGIVRSLQNKIRLARIAIASILTPPVGEIRLGADTVSGHVVQLDSNGSIIDLAGVANQLDSIGFDAHILWTFDSSTLGFTPFNGALAFDTANGTGCLLTATATGAARITSPAGLSIDGNLYRRIKASVTLVTSPAPILPNVIRAHYATSGGSAHGLSPSFRKFGSYSIPFLNVGDTAILDFDMTSLSTGGNDWILATGSAAITQLQLVLTDNIGTVVRVNWVAVGANRPTVKPASGTGVLTFGASNVARLTVTGQTWVTANSAINVAVLPKATAQHSEDEHIILSSILGLTVPAASIVPGVGFDIVGVANTSGVIGGTVNVQWVGVP